VTLSSMILQNPRTLVDSQLSLTDKGIDVIDIIDSQKLITLTVLKLSKNKIRSALNVQQFPNLRQLDLSQNLLSSYSQVVPPLRNLPSLENLRVDGNPLCLKYPHFLDVLVARLSPSLKVLNGIKVSEDAVLNAI